MHSLRCGQIRALALGTSIAMTLAGCGKGECTRFAGCPAVDQQATAEDDIVELGSGALVSFTVQGQTSVQVLDGGEVVFLPEQRACVPSQDNPCRLTLKRLMFRLRNFEIDLSNGEKLNVQEVVDSVVTPLQLQDDGAGYVIPAGTSSQTCSTIAGRSKNGQAPSSQNTVLILDEYAQRLQVDAEFELVTYVDDDECDELRIAVNLLAGGISPWKQAPK